MNKRQKNIIAITLTCMMTSCVITSNFVTSQKVYAKGIVLSDKENEFITVNDAIKDITEYYQNGYLNQVGKDICAYQWGALKKAGVTDFSKWNVNKKVDNLDDQSITLRGSAKAQQSMILMDVGEDPTKFEGMNLISDIVNDLNEILKEMKVSSMYKGGGQVEAKMVTAVNRFNKAHPDKRIEFKSTSAENESMRKDDIWVVKGNTEEKKYTTLNSYSSLIQMLSYYKDEENISKVLSEYLKLYKESVKENGGIYTKGIYATCTQTELINALLRSEENLMDFNNGKCNLIDGLFINWDGKCFRDYNNFKSMRDFNEVFYTLLLLKESGQGEYKINNLSFKNIDYTKEAVVEKIDISPKEDKKELKIGEKLQFNAKITPGNAVNKEISWISSNTKVIDIDENGLATAVGAGDVSIYVWSNNCVESNRYKLKVQPQPVTAIEIDKNKIEIRPKESARVSVKVLPENASNKKNSWLSSDEKIVKVDNEGFLTGIQPGNAVITAISEDGNFKATCEVTVIGTGCEGDVCKKYNEEVNDTIDEISKNIDMSKIDINNTELKKADYWTILDLSKAGKGLPKDYLKNITDKIKNNKEPMYTSDYCKIVLAVLASGGDPSNIGGCNIIKEIYSGSMNSIYDYSFGLIALDSGNYAIPENSKWNRNKIINEIVNSQTRDNGWAFGGNKADIDTTAMVISALAPYYNSKSDVKNAVDKALKMLSLKQGIEGEFTNFDGTSNSSSVSMVIIGLCANGIDVVKDERFIKNEKNLIDVLMKYKTEDKKGFGFKDNKYNEVGTEQGLRALVAYKNLKESNGSVYKFKIASSEKIFRIQNITDVRKIKLGSEGKVVVKATNLSKEDKDASLIIGLFDKDGKMYDYVSTKENIKAGEDSELMAMLKIPEAGEYTLKGFIWDNIKNMNNISDVIEIPVK